MKNGHDILPPGILAKAMAASDAASKKPETPEMVLAREIRAADAACMASPTEENLDILSALRRKASEIDANENRLEFKARKGQSNQKRSRQGYNKDDPLLRVIFG